MSTCLDRTSLLVVICAASVTAGVGCASSSSPPVLSNVAECPEVSLAEADTFPRIRYVTFFVDGVVVGENHRQLAEGPHVVTPLDSLPPEVSDLKSDEIERLEVLLPPESEARGACPGVSALMITTTKGDSS